MKVSEVTSQFSDTQQELLKAKSKLAELDSALAPTQKKLQAKETECQQLIIEKRKI